MTKPNPVADVIVRELKDALQGIVDGSREDLAQYAQDLTTAGVAAVEAGDELSLASIQRTMVMLREKAGIRVRHGTWDTVETVAWAVVRAGLLAARIPV